MERDQMKGVQRGKRDAAATLGWGVSGTSPRAGVHVISESLIIRISNPYIHLMLFDTGLFTSHRSVVKSGYAAKTADPMVQTVPTQESPRLACLVTRDIH